MVLNMASVHLVIVNLVTQKEISLMRSINIHDRLFGTRSIYNDSNFKIKIKQVGIVFS